MIVRFRDFHWTKQPGPMSSLVQFQILGLNFNPLLQEHLRNWLARKFLKICNFDKNFYFPQGSIHKMKFFWEQGQKFQLQNFMWVF